MSSCCNRWKEVAAFFLMLGIAGSSEAVTLRLGLGDDPTSFKVYDDAQLGCLATGPDTQTCTGGGDPGPPSEATMPVLHVLTDSGPASSTIRSLGTVVIIQNVTAAPEIYTLIFSLPVVPIPEISFIHGDLGGRLSSLQGSSGPPTLSTSPPTGLYVALIDGAPVQTLFPDPTSFSPGDLTGTGFDIPMPGQPGAVESEIGIQYKFRLGAHSGLILYGSFSVDEIPEPGTGLLVATGLLGLAYQQRRRGRAA